METTPQQTRSLAAYLCSMDVSKFSDHAVDFTKMCIQDFIGVAIAGSAKKESEI